MIYFDTSYLVRLYFEDPGWETIRTRAAEDEIACCLHGRAEVIAAFHRKFREGAITSRDMTVLIEQFKQDCAAGAIRWLPLALTVIARLTQVYGSLPDAIAVRAADAIHLSCASENGFKEVYSNDQRLLAAASHFGVNGVNLI